MKTRPIILCGGSGTRLWPESRENFPKQFIPTKDVNPKSKLSKQFNYFRSEHWFITQGKGSVSLDGKTQILKKGNSIDIPKKSIHYIENQTDKILTFIEIQMGIFFGKDDIYARK